MRVRIPPLLYRRQTGKGANDVSKKKGCILGHADIKTSQIYTQAIDEGLKRLMKALADGTDTVFPTAMDQRPTVTV